MEVGNGKYGFITGLPHYRNLFDSIWVIVDRMSTFAYFLPVRTTYSGEYYAKLYIQEIVRLHGASMSIIFDRGINFLLSFGSFQKILGTQVNLSTTFHPQTYEQTKLTIQTLEDMLKRVCY